MSSVTPQPDQPNESLEHNMTHFVTPEPLDMNVEWNVPEERPPVARQLFPNDDEIEDPPRLVRSEASAAVVVPWDEEEEFPAPPVLVRQNAGDGTAVVWSSDEEEEEEDEDMETLSVSSESTDGIEDFEERYQELMQQGQLLTEQMNHMVTLLGQRTFSNIPQ